MVHISCLVDGLHGFWCSFQRWDIGTLAGKTLSGCVIEDPKVGHCTWHSCLVFTALWCGCSVIKLTFFLHQTPSWLWLVYLSSPHKGIDQLAHATNKPRTPLYQKYYGHTSSPRILGLYHIQCFDCIKMADDHDVKWETAGKALGTEPLCFL